MSPWIWVGAAYGGAALLVGGYVVWLWRRFRRATGQRLQEVEW